MKREPVREGDVVLSRAGRDSGRTFVVLKTIDENFVLIVDGRLRTLDRPKKKKRMHLLKASDARMELSGRLLDADFRKFLSAQGYCNKP
jgi:ribosomal protein L14E/L6E/L27E